MEMITIIRPGSKCQGQKISTSTSLLLVYGYPCFYFWR